MLSQLVGRSAIRVSLSVPRHAESVRLIRTVTGCILDDLGAPDNDRDDLLLAMTEGCENVVEHAEGTSEYHVALKVTRDGCEVDVIDHGPGVDPAMPERAARGDQDEESGRGLAVMDALVDELTFSDLQRGTRLRLRKRWDTGQEGRTRLPA